MVVIADRIIITLLSMAVYLLNVEGSFEDILLLFIFLTLSAIFMYIERPIINSCIAIIGLLISFLFPQTVFIIPLLAYDSAFSKRIEMYMFSAFTALITLYFSPFRFETLIYIILIAAAAAFTALRTEKKLRTEQQLVSLKDSERELHILMGKTRSDMLARQESEIHIATLKERNRIAREIHDNVGHMLSRSILMVGALKAVNSQNALTEPLDGLKSTLDGAMDSIRSSVHNLHDEAIDLRANIELLIKDFSFCTIKMDYDMSDKASRDTKYCILTIIKEALSNISKHSNATSAEITLREHPGLYQLLILDNGTQTKNTDNTGIGLENMTDRVRELGGTIYFKSENGFRIFVTIPKTENNR